MNSNPLRWILPAMLPILTHRLAAEELVNGRPSLVFENSKARLVVDLSGGAIGDFHLRDQKLNPLQWGAPAEGDKSVRGFGHFLCLDRWGPPSTAEGAKGMPYHGEAANVAWTTTGSDQTSEEMIQRSMQTRLPKAGLMIKRTIRFSSKESLFAVQEDVTNENALGRVYNAVQHPTISPPFLDSTTVVDCNGRRGFAQGGTLPNPEEPSAYWPSALNASGETVNLRHLNTDPNPNVVSYQIDASHGWVTAVTPGKGLLIGYVWKTSDYPWVNLWRDVRNGKPAARGLEFGTTGLHQPFPILTKKGRIWDRQLFEFLDAGETVHKTYAGFLIRVPTDFQGVESLRIDGSRLVIQERKPDHPRELTLDGRGILPF